MAIDLVDYEEPACFDGDIAAENDAVRSRLSALQNRHVAHGCRSLIIVEGWDGSAKGAIAKALARCLDPFFFRTFYWGDKESDASGRHFLWPYWQTLPSRGQIVLWSRSHYRRVLDERVDGLCSEAEWKRAFDEINEFEAQLRDSGTQIIKLFLHLSGEQQRDAFVHRMHDPEQRWSVKPAQLHRLSTRSAYLEALAEMFARCDTRWAPWKILNGAEPEQAALAALRHATELLGRHVPVDLPAVDPEAAKLADLLFSGNL